MPEDDGLDRVIASLSGTLRPVKVIRRPLVRAAVWVGVVTAAGAALACVADDRGMMDRLCAAPDMWLAVLGSALTAVSGAVATFHLGMPDRGPRWALLPIPSLALWLGASGFGCARTWVLPGTHDASLVESRTCFGFIVLLSVPLSILTVAMVRRAFPLRPNLTALVGGLAVAAAAATLLNFFHPYDATVTDLAVHLLAVGVVIGCNQVAARGVLRGAVPARAVPGRG